MADEKDRIPIAVVQDLINRSNVRLTLDVYFLADGIRPNDLPDDIETPITAIIAKRLPPMIHAAEVGAAGCWRLRLRAVQYAMKTLADG